MDKTSRIFCKIATYNRFTTFRKSAANQVITVIIPNILSRSGDSTSYQTLGRQSSTPLVFCIHGNKWGMANCCDDLEENHKHGDEDATVMEMEEACH